MNIRAIAFYGMILLVVALSVYAFVYIRSESYKCMNSPLVYGISHLQASTGEVTCSCSAPNIAGYLFITKYNQTWVSTAMQGGTMPQINFSGIHVIK